MSQNLENETVQSVIGKLARRSISEPDAKRYLAKRAQESREYFVPTFWTALKRYTRSPKADRNVASARRAR